MSERGKDTEQDARFAYEIFDWQAQVGEVSGVDIAASDGNSLDPSIGNAILCGGLREVHKPWEHRFAGNFRVTQNLAILAGAASLGAILFGLYMARKDKHSESAK